MTKEIAKSSNSDLDQADLSELAVIANKFHAQVEESGRSMLQAAWNAGQALLSAKVLCEHGDWIPWVESNFRGSLRTAQVYMQLAGNAQTSAHLESGTSIDSALDSIREQAAPPKSKRAKGKQESTARDRYVKRYNAASESLSVIVHDVQNDPQFASAASESIAELVELRDGLSKLIGVLRKSIRLENRT